MSYKKVPTGHSNNTPDAQSSAGRAGNKPFVRNGVDSNGEILESNAYSNLNSDIETAQVRMCRPVINEQDISAVVDVLRSGNLALGPVAEEFEKQVAEYIGVKYAVAVSSGTTGLHLCAIAAGIKPGDEVITTPFSFIASSNCILYQNATPVFVDIEPETYNIDPNRIEDAITSRTRAIVAVDIFGQAYDADSVNDIAQRHGLTVIEDACEAIGAEYKGRRAGSLGDFATLGFYPNKQMTAGEGGMILTNREESVGLFHSLRNQGRDTDTSKQTHVQLGFNYRLDELSAALGLSQFKRIEELLAQREKVAQMYGERLHPISGIRTLQAAPYTTRQTWFAYIIQLPENISRVRFIEELQILGVPSRAYFDPIHLQPLYRERFGYSPGYLPMTESLAGRTLAIPFHGEMTSREVDRVCESIKKVLANLSPDSKGR